MSESITYFRELVRDQRHAPGNGLLGELVRRHGDDLSDDELAGRTIRDGDIVVCSLSAANRDPSMFTAPGEIEPDRMASKHVAFGYGAHRCIGAELARMELRAAYPALVRRFPRMRLAVRQEELSFRGLSIVYGLHSLPVVPH